MANSSPQPERINELIDAVYPSFALLAGMELDLFSTLEHGPLTAGQMADALGVSMVKLRPLLYVLVNAGLLIVDGDLFSNSAETDYYLVRGKPTYIGGIYELNASNWSKLLKLAKTIRAEGSLDNYDYHSLPQEELIAIFRGLYPGAVSSARRLMDQFDFSQVNTLLDVGGGSGALAITIAQAHPHLKVSVIELPLVTPIARQFVQEAQLRDRVEIRTGDAVREQLSGSYDVVVARHLIQVLSVEDSRALLKNLAAVVKPGGFIHLIGMILDNSRLAPRTTVDFNLVLLTGYEDGQAYTEQEYYEWLADAGFVDFVRVVFPDGGSIVTARKPDQSDKPREV